MKYIQLGLALLVALFIYTVTIGIWMKVANCIGDRLRIGKLFVSLWGKTTQKNRV